MKKNIYILLNLICPILLLGQQPYFPMDSLNADSVELLEIDLRHGNTYRFRHFLREDSVYLLMPPQLPKGYYEAYYDGDTNKLALTYYRFGRHSYAQQYYRDGSMKSDTEYDRYGLRHGMHVLYDRAGEELWHVDFYRGALEKEYSPAYIEAYNYTQVLIENGKAWGCYEFEPTPMRARHDQLHLREDGTFSYHNFKADCPCRRHSEGKWTLKGDRLELSVDNEEVWGQKKRVYVILANRRHKRRQLIWMRPWGAHWYASEYWFCRRCECMGE
jgi:hypothetical protein